ncbi:unnamed protein product [Bursaphelenchus okinawaensis]|uniref:Uncharacterized protein n=1 Tax=Bursaphelenchus okinawaensis TaxID=465554 RepID=A0A811KJR9_9BILA|nr:unnamed protein product [Bursaphelenchus okinawaensis]CAG9105147.1 unnamed protein product [Bursaphelenchus okinawaensis]
MMDRARYINQMFELWMYVPAQVPDFDCLTYIQFAYPLYVQKMLYDYMSSDQQWYQRFHENCFTYANVLMQQAEEMLKYSNILDDENKKAALHHVLQDKFAFFNHSFYEDANFQEYAGSVSDINPLSSVHVNNLRPLVAFNYDKNEKLWSIPTIMVIIFAFTEV